MENGKNISLLRRFCKALGLVINWQEIREFTLQPEDENAAEVKNAVDLRIKDGYYVPIKVRYKQAYPQFSIIGIDLEESAGLFLENVLNHGILLESTRWFYDKNLSFPDESITTLEALEIWLSVRGY